MTNSIAISGKTAVYKFIDAGFDISEEHNLQIVQKAMNTIPNNGGYYNPDDIYAYISKLNGREYKSFEIN